MNVHLVDPPSLDAQRVLVYLDDLPVLEDGLVLGSDGPQVDGHEEGSGEDGPHCHLRLALLIRQAKIS